MKYAFLILFCCSLTVLLACGNKGTGPGLERIIPLEGRVQFEVEEGYESYDSQSVPTIKISSQTEEIYPNCNYVIITDTERDRETHSAVVNYDAIYLPDILLPALGPASSYVNLPLTENSRYLTLGLHGQVDIYRATVTDSYIRFQPIRADFTILTNNLYWRYRANSFVYLYSTNSDNYYHYTRFLDTLESVVNLEEFSYPDSGKIPYPRADEWPNPQSPPRYFVYDNDIDFLHIAEVFEAYVLEYLVDDNSVWIQIISWKNQKLNSLSL